MSVNVNENRDLIQNRLDKVWNRMTAQREPWNYNLHYWEWQPGVGMYSMMRAYEETGDQRYLAYIEDWALNNADKRRFGSVNWVIPANILLFMHQRTGDAKYMAYCQEYVDWCLNKALRTSNGGLAHVWEGGSDDFKNQLWVDSLFMAGIFMVKMGVYDNNSACVEEGLKQFDIHIEGLFNPACNLYYHGYHCLTDTKLGRHWGRGNGWAAASIVELLDALKDSSYDTSRFADIFAKHMESVYRLRMEDGMLRTLLDEEDAYVETSASALFGYAALRGYKLGYLDEKFRDWGLQIAASIIRDHLEEDGNVLNGTGGTDPQTKEGYLSIPFFPTQYTFGAVLMLMAESLEG